MIDPKDINELIREGRITINETKLEFSDEEDFDFPFVDTITGVEIGDVNDVFPWKTKLDCYNYARFIDDRPVQLFDGDHAWVRAGDDPGNPWMPVVVESLTKDGLWFYRGGDRFMHHNGTSGGIACYRNWRLPTRKELEDAGIDPDDKNQHKGSFTEG